MKKTNMIVYVGYERNLKPIYRTLYYDSENKLYFYRYDNKVKILYYNPLVRAFYYDVEFKNIADVMDCRWYNIK